MNKFKFSNYKLPHMKSAFPLKKVVKKVEKPIDKTPERLDIPEPIPIRNNGAAPKQIVSSVGGSLVDNVKKTVSDYESQFDRPEFKEFIEKERGGYGADEFKRMYAVVEPGGKYRLKDLSGDMEHVDIPEGMKYPESEKYLRDEGRKNLRKRGGYFSDKAFMSNY